jgi:hypothetical protein
MKTSHLFCLAVLLSGSTLWSQQTASPTPLPSLPGPPIEKRAPASAQWLITTMLRGPAASTTDATGKPVKPPSTNKIMVTKTGKIYRVESLDGYQQLWTVWAKGATQIMVWPDKRSVAELAASNNPDAPNPLSALSFRINNG